LWFNHFLSDLLKLSPQTPFNLVMDGVASRGETVCLLSPAFVILSARQADSRRVRQGIAMAQPDYNGRIIEYMHPEAT
jgi:hypothetical protein